MGQGANHMGVQGYACAKAGANNAINQMLKEKNNEDYKAFDKR